MLNRRTVLKSAAAAAAGVSVSGTSGAKVASKGPNVLYVLTDQWRASATGYAGDPNVRTPNLDKLAARSLRFVNAVSVCPVCTPYRAALLTGQYPTTNGMFLNDLYLPDRSLCLAEAFKGAGYRTGYIGKWHLDGHGRQSYIPPARRQGFDFWQAEECDHNYNRHHYYAGESSEKRIWEGYSPPAQTKVARQFIRDHAKDDAPFLLVVSYGTPHFPHGSAPQRLKAHYPPKSIKLSKNVPPDIAARARSEACGYYAHCEALDRCVGDLLATLEQAGIAEDTILVFTSDHGEMMGSHGQRPCGKQRPWDESVRVPFLLRYPSAHGKTGRKVTTSINTPDILPTLLGLAGVDIPKSVEGADLSALVRGQQADSDRPALIMNVSPFADYFAGKEYRGVRTSRYTYVRDLSGPWLLYDNQADPQQMRNLANKHQYAVLQKRMEALLTAELKRIGDDFRPRVHYLRKWGYEVDKRGCIPYRPDSRMQTPKAGVREGRA